MRKFLFLTLAALLGVMMLSACTTNKESVETDIEDSEVQKANTQDSEETLATQAPKEYEVELLDDLDAITYVNGMDVTGIGDPYVIAYDNLYYMTSTVNGSQFDLYKSSDMKKWSYVKKIFGTSYGKGWVRSNLWQPQLIIGDDGKFYLYFCGNNSNGSLRIGVAVADTIEGPYVDAKKEPLFDLGYATIDPYLFKDDDGKMHLFYSRDCSENIVDGCNTSQIYVVEMEAYTKVKDGAEHKLLLTPEQKWELVSGAWRWNEGPDVLKHDGKYYLFYSANFYGGYNYSIGYAVSDQPEGPYVKSEQNPVLFAIGDMSGPGNNSFFYSLDGKDMFTAYHTHTDAKTAGGDRKLTIDRCGFREDGSFYINGPTIAKQPEPSGERTFIKDILDLEVSSSAEGTKQETLMDGAISKSVKDVPYEWKTTADDAKKEIVVEFETEKELKEIVLYRNFDLSTVPDSVSIYLDDGGVIKNVTLPEDPMEPVILSFEAKKTKHVRIVMSGKAGSELGLAEIMFEE